MDAGSVCRFARACDGHGPRPMALTASYSACECTETARRSLRAGCGAVFACASLAAYSLYMQTRLASASHFQQQPARATTQAVTHCPHTRTRAHAHTRTRTHAHESVFAHTLTRLQLTLHPLPLCSVGKRPPFGLPPTLPATGSHMRRIARAPPP